jgi:hypothetical protein
LKQPAPSGLAAQANQILFMRGRRSLHGERRFLVGSSKKPRGTFIETTIDRFMKAMAPIGQLLSQVSFVPLDSTVTEINCTKTTTFSEEV